MGMREKLMQIIASKHELLINLNTSIPKLFKLAEHLIANDVVQVVRCKDCKHWHEKTGWCYHHSHFLDSKGGFCHPWESNDWKMFDDDYFCKDGERRTDDI